MKKNNKQMRIGVIGLGPVGSILTAHLIEAGAFVVPCDRRPNRMDKLKESGIKLTHTIEKHIKVSEVCCSVQELERHELDLVIIAVKTPCLNKVVTQLTEIKSNKMYVMCAQNGIDNEEEVAQVFGYERTLRMVVNYAGNMTSLSSVRVSFFNPPNYVAALAPQGEPIAKKFAELLNSLNLDTEIPDDIQDYVWQKTILNAALSAVCTVTKKTIKEVMDFPLIEELVEAIIDESVRVAEAERIELGKKFRRFSIRYLRNAGHHRPSMLIDMENGKQTEIEQVNGKIVHYGQYHCLPTPLNHSLTALIHFLEYSADQSKSKQVHH